MNKQKFLKWFIFSIAVAINLFILINAFINGEVSTKESNTIAHTTADVINTVKPEPLTPANFDRFAFDLRKVVGHFGLFAFSGVFSTWATYLFSKDSKVGYFLSQIMMDLSFGFVMALLSEFVQIFIDGRTGAWADVGIDFAGFFLGFSVVFLIFLLRKSKIFKKENYMKNQAK